MSDPLSQPLVMRPEDSIRWLQVLLDWYGSEEERYYKRLWGDENERDPGAFSTGMENEWMRYRQEAAALRAGIVALGGQPLNGPEK